MSRITVTKEFEAKTSDEMEAARELAIVYSPTSIDSGDPFNCPKGEVNI